MTFSMAGALSQPRQSCQFPFLLDEKSTVVPVRLAGEQSEGKRKVSYSRTQSERLARDRQRYLRWVFEAKKRFGLSVLDYMVTSNHVHLLIKDTGPNVIAGGMQLVNCWPHRSGI